MWSFSCLAGSNLVQSALEKELPMVAENGEATRRYLQLLVLEAPQVIDFTAAFYPRWRVPGAWATPEEQIAFFEQTPRTPPAEARVDFPTALIYYMGPCETDQLLRRVHNEALARHPGKWLMGVVRAVGRMLVQAPTATFDLWQLPRDANLTYTGTHALGFRTAAGDFYDGQMVWRPGIRSLPPLFDIWNRLKWLTPLALLWALWRRAWLYTLPAVLMLAFYVVAAALDSVEPRTSYAPVYPLASLLIGGLVCAAWESVRRITGSE